MGTAPMWTGGRPVSSPTTTSGAVVPTTPKVIPSSGCPSIRALADERALTVIRQEPGSRGRRTPASGQDQGRVVAVSVFEGRANAMRVSERVVGIMREKAKEMAPEPPRVTAGEAAVVASA